LRAKLVQTLLNSYMVQFLETGFLHADPHPGNFLLMPDGRLCIPGLRHDDGDRR
jgi:predicted unusual protein kinase regulating ubiquinone biosynthesis (AarF/ABC1/UbiB family)